MKPCLPLPHGQLRFAAADDLDALLVLLHDEEAHPHLCDDTILPTH